LVELGSILGKSSYFSVFYVVETGYGALRTYLIGMLRSIPVGTAVRT
jgi:hypothetical protein